MDTPLLSDIRSCVTLLISAKIELAKQTSYAEHLEYELEVKYSKLRELETSANNLS